MKASTMVIPAAYFTSGRFARNFRVSDDYQTVTCLLDNTTWDVMEDGNEFVRLKIATPPTPTPQS